MLRQQERRRVAIEEKEIKKLKRAMKKKEKLERKLKKHDKKESRKKSKKVLDDDSDFSEGDMLVSECSVHLKLSSFLAPVWLKPSGYM